MPRRSRDPSPDSPSPPPARGGHRDDLAPPAPRRRDDPYDDPPPRRHRDDPYDDDVPPRRRQRDDPSDDDDPPPRHRRADVRDDELSPPGASSGGRHRDELPLRTRGDPHDDPRDDVPPVDEQPVVNETMKMISGMKPYLHRDTYVFTELPYENGAALPALLPHLHSLTTEREAMSLLLPRSVAKEQGLPVNLSPRLSHIELSVRSGLEGVGLTAAISAALSAGQIACNIVAGLRHDHIFVPEDRAEMAVDVLKALAKQTRKMERDQRRAARAELESPPGPPLAGPRTGP